MKEKFLTLCRENIHREGIDKLLTWLEKSDFFTAPASTRYHGAHEGGLCEHSINVFYELESWDADFASPGTLAIVSLLHDLCKVNYYKRDVRNVKENGVWVQKPYYTVDDKFPYGHGEKSVFMIERFMRLTNEEAFAIRFHMGAYSDPNTGKAFEKYPLALLLHQADERATFMMEVRNND